MVKKMKITSIQLYEDTKRQLEKKKLHHRESYDEVIKRLIGDDSNPSMEEMFRRSDRLSQDREYKTEEVVEMIRKARENASFH
jgi:hydrogenase maturation factor HypE